MTVPEMHIALDAAIEELKAKAAELGGPATCRGTGCFGCCKEPVQCSREEVECIVEGLSDEQKEYVGIKLARWLAQVTGSGLLRDAEPHVFLWRMMNAWCPLLDIDGSCLAYGRHPFSCRLHIASGDPAACYDDTRRLRQKFIFNPQLLGQITAQQIATAGKVEFNHLGLWLAEILLGKIIETPARFKVTGHLDSASGTLNLNLREMPDRETSAQI